MFKYIAVQFYLYSYLGTIDAICDCSKSPHGAAMMRNPILKEQLRGGNEPWKRKFEGKFRLYEQKLTAYKAGWTDEVAMSAEIQYIIKNP